MNINIQNRKKKTYEYVIDTIKLMLVDGQLEEGQKLPNQTEFAQQLGVSRLALREALHALENIGVVVQKPKTGTVIINGDPSKWVKTVSAPLLSDKDATYELIEARKVIESSLASYAARNVTKEHIDVLRRIVDKWEATQEKNIVLESSRLDMEFHLYVAKIANNRYLLNMFMNLSSLTSKMISEVTENLPEMVIGEQGTHRKIFEALQANDAEEAAKSQIIHLDSIWQYYQKYYVAEL